MRRLLVLLCLCLSASVAAAAEVRILSASVAAAAAEVRILSASVAAAAAEVRILSASVATAAAEVRIPAAAARYRADLVRAAHYHWGLDAPVAAFAAQIHAESRWRTDAVSPVGARGMAQFMPATAGWIAGAYKHLRENDPSNPQWAMRALVTYDRYLWDRVSASGECQRMAKTLAAYNGGLGWVQRDDALAARRGLDASRWFGAGETVNAGRNAAAKRENQRYPRIILLETQPAYEAAGWGKGVNCDD